MIPWHPPSPYVQSMLEGANRIRTVVLVAALVIALLSAVALVIRYADVIDGWTWR